jgi:hypothetical protein
MSQRNEVGTADKQESWQSGENANNGKTKPPQDSRTPNINLTGGKAQEIQEERTRFLYAPLKAFFLSSKPLNPLFSSPFLRQDSYMSCVLIHQIAYYRAQRCHLCMFIQTTAAWEQRNIGK